jgi:hypothetical protein
MSRKQVAALVGLAPYDFDSGKLKGRRCYLGWSMLDDGGGAAQSVFDVCSRVNKRVHRVRSKEEIEPAWFDGAEKAAIIGGILVPP